MSSQADPLAGGAVRSSGVLARVARGVLRPLTTWLAARLLWLARKFDPVGAHVTGEAPPRAQQLLARELLLLGGWSSVLSDAELPRFARELADSGVLRRIMQGADAAAFQQDLVASGLLPRLLQGADAPWFLQELVASGLLGRMLQGADAGSFQGELAASGLLHRVMRDGELQQLAGVARDSGLLARIAREADIAAVSNALFDAGLLDRIAWTGDARQFAAALVRTNLLRLTLEQVDADALGSTVADSGVLRRLAPAQRLPLVPAVVQAPEALWERWPDLDQVVNFSQHLRSAWVARQASLVPAGARVLDAGAGQGQYRPLFAHARYHSQDFAQYEGSDSEAAPERWDYIKLDYVCDITAIPVADASFDAVLCTEVLEHVPDAVATLRELARVTAPGGRLLLTAPLGSGMHQEPYHFYGGFSRHFWQKMLPELGFDIDEIVPLRGLMSHVAQEVHRAGRYLGIEGLLTAEQAWVMQEWLPRALHDADEAVPVEQFTVGYMVRATKRRTGAEMAA